MGFVDNVALYLPASDIMVIFGSRNRLLHEIRCNSKTRLRTIGQSYESSDIFWAFVGTAEYEYVLVDRVAISCLINEGMHRVNMQG